MDRFQRLACASALLPLLGCLGPYLRAQAPQGGLRLGIHAGIVDSQGDLRNDMGTRLGLEAGLSLEIPLSRVLSLRPQLDFQRFPTLENSYNYRSTRYSDKGTEYYKLSAWSAGADCLYHPLGQGRPLYFLAGAYLKAWRLNSSGSFVTTDKFNGTRKFLIDETTTQDEPALSLGTGYAFTRHLGLESRMTFATYRKLSYNTIQLVAFCTF